MKNNSNKQILIVSDDTVDSNMGGMGVRNWELSHTLSEYFDVTLAVPNQTTLISKKIRLVSYSRDKPELQSIAGTVDVIIVQGFVLHFQPQLAELHIPLAVDLYVPSLLESLVWHDQENWDDWIPHYEEYLRVQLDLLRHGDFFFCASERQRDYWLGWLHAQKRINPHTYRHSPSLRKLIDVVPFGLSENPPVSTRHALKGVYPGIEPTDKLIVWSGGLWDWLDPLTLIRAVGKLVPQNPEIKLFFLGARHPNPVVSGMKMHEQSVRLSQELGLYEEHVFFNDWVPYQERGAYLADADLAVVSHSDHIETHFSFRTRVMDCIWAGLPMISTQGDTFAELISNHNLGIVVPPGDTTAMAEAILKLIQIKGKKTLIHSFNQLRKEMHWNRVAQPLIQFCQFPYFSPDKSQYLTETERMSREKDAFLENVIREKDGYIEQIIHDKDAHLAEVIEAKDNHLAEVILAKDAFLEKVVQEKDNDFLTLIQEKESDFRTLIQEKDAAKELALSEQREFFNQLLGEKDSVIRLQQQQLEKIQRSIPFRLYSKAKRLIGR